MALRLRLRQWLSVLGLACLVLAVAGARAFGQGSDPYQVQVIQTAPSLAQELTRLPALDFGPPGSTAGIPVIRVNASVRFQRVQGFGAAVTDTAAWLIESLPASTEQAVMSALFGAAGIHLDYVKVPMGASDFTHDGIPYTYDDLAPGQSDPGLAHFSIAHDQAYVLPALRQARTLDPALRLLATPWTPPAWMKTNDSLGNGADRGVLRRTYYRAWAQYFVDFLRAYARAGVPVGSVTPQNEPGIPTLYPGLNLPAGSEGTWIEDYLKPALARAHLRTRVYGGDLGWGPTTDYFSALLHGPAGRALAGLAWHCYYGSPAVMSRFHELDPQLDQIVDECSPGYISPTPMSEILISSLRNWASAVSLWNLALNPTGGPAQPPNHGCKGCQGLFTVDQATGAATPTLAYFQLGQLSAFVQPGARRVSAGNFVSYVYPHSGVNVVTPGLDDVALRNPDGSLVLVAYDNSSAPITFAVAWRGRQLRYQLPPEGMVTLVWNQAG